jgi:hypothetical protein
MALLFVAGVINLAEVAAITVAVLLEKATPRSRQHFGRGVPGRVSPISDQPTPFAIGHSTRLIETFIGLLMKRRLPVSSTCDPPCH